MNRIGNVQLWILSSKLTFILLRIRIIGLFTICWPGVIGTKRLGRLSPMFYPLRLLVTPLYDIVKKCQDGDHKSLTCRRNLVFNPKTYIFKTIVLYLVLQFS